MKRWVYAHRAVAGDPAQLDKLLRTRLDALIRAATDTPHATREADGGLRVPLDPSLLGVPAKVIHIKTGVATTCDGNRLHIPIAWHAEPGHHAFPRFEGRLGLEPLSGEAAKLTILGSYSPPAGVVGAAVDATLLRGVAQRTVDRLVDALADELRRAPEVPTARPPAPPYAPMCVADVMTAEVLVVDEDLPVRTAALLLLHHEIGGAPVVDAEGALIGVVSEADLLAKEILPPRGLNKAAGTARRRWSAVTVGELCSRPALTTAPDVSLHDAAQLMREKGVARLVVVAESRIAGIITRHDILKTLARSDLELQLAVDQLLAARRNNTSGRRQTTASSGSRARCAGSAVAMP